MHASFVRILMQIFPFFRNLDTSLFTSTRNQRYLSSTSKYLLNLRSVLLLFQSFTEKPVFEFAYPMILFYHIWWKTLSIDHVSSVCKLAMKKYLMRMCVS